MKKTIYILLATILGILLSTLAHSGIELWYLGWTERTGHDITWTLFFGIGLCAFPPWLQYGLLILGAVGGFLLGRWWWRLVYVEGRHWRRKQPQGNGPA